MPKQGMSRPDWTHVRPKNDVAPVPEIQGKAKSGKVRANPIIPGQAYDPLKVYHGVKGNGNAGKP